MYIHTHTREHMHILTHSHTHTYIILTCTYNTQMHTHTHNLCSQLVLDHDEQENKKAIQLGDCMKLFTETKKLDEEDPWLVHVLTDRNVSVVLVHFLLLLARYCPDCKDFMQGSKKFDLWKLPEILVIHLKRFSYER